jgi:hypothetical protein
MRPPGAHGDPAAVRGELDRVRQQVDHYLLEPQLVGVDGPDVHGDGQLEGDVVVGGPLAE